MSNDKSLKEIYNDDTGAGGLQGDDLLLISRKNGSSYVTKAVTANNVPVSVAGRTGVVTLSKTDVNLANVDDTSDANKPVSTAQQTAIDLKANAASPNLTGVPTAPTATPGTNTTQLATTEFVAAGLAGGATPADGDKGDIVVSGAGSAWAVKTGLNATKIANGSVSNTEFQYLDGLTSSAQTQLDGKVSKSGDTITGNLTIRDNATPTKAYRFRTSGSSLDLETGGTEIHLSTWTNPNFTGTQYEQLVMKSDGSAIAVKQNMDMNTHTISGVVNPVNAQDAATKNYVDAQVVAGNPDATTAVKGKVQLAGDLGGTAASPAVKSRTSLTLGATTGDFPVSSYANFRAALLAGLAAAQTANIELKMLPGTFDLTSQAVFHDLGNVTLRGSGKGKTIIRRTYNNATSMIDFGDADGPTAFGNLTISDLTIDQNLTGSGFGLAAPWFKNVLIENCSFINQGTTSLAGLLVGKFAGGSDSFEAYNIRVVNCDFDYSNATSLSWEVVTVTAGRDVSFEGCRWQGVASNWPGLSVYNTEQFRMINCFVNAAQITYGGRGTYLIEGNQFEQSSLFVNQAKNTSIIGNSWYSFGTTTGLPNGIIFKGGYKTGSDAETPWYIVKNDFTAAAVSAAADTITLLSTTLYPTGTVVRVTPRSGGTNPGGVIATTDYYVINVSSTTIKLALNATDALAGTAIDIASAGTGNLRITESTIFSCENVIVDGNTFTGCKDNAIYAKTTTESGKEVLDVRDLQITNNKFDGITQIPIVAFAKYLRVQNNQILNGNTTAISGNDTHMYIAAESAMITNNFGSSSTINNQGIIIDVERFLGVIPIMRVYANGNILNTSTLVRHYNSVGSLNTGPTTNVSWQPLTLEAGNNDILSINALANNSGIIRFRSNGTERGIVYNPSATNDMVVRAQGNVQLIADHLVSDDVAEWSSTGLNLNSHKITNVTDPTSAQDAATKNYVDSAAAPTAAAVSFAPAGSIAATNVQTAIQELDTEKQAALGYTAANDANVLHLTGNETATGRKTIETITTNGGSGDLLILNGTGTNNSILRFQDDGTERGAVFSTNATTGLTVRSQADLLLTSNASGTSITTRQNAVGLGVAATPTSTLQSGGSFALPIRTVTANTTATATDFTILVDATAGNITVTLPAVSTISGRKYVVKKIDATANTVTIDANAAETIDGAATQVITAQWDSVTIQNNAAAWFII